MRRKPGFCRRVCAHGCHDLLRRGTCVPRPDLPRSAYHAGWHYDVTPEPGGRLHGYGNDILPFHARVRHVPKGWIALPCGQDRPRTCHAERTDAQRHRGLAPAGLCGKKRGCRRHRDGFGRLGGPENRSGLEKPSGLGRRNGNQRSAPYEPHGATMLPAHRAERGGLPFAPCRAWQGQQAWRPRHRTGVNHCVRTQFPPGDQCRGKTQLPLRFDRVVGFVGHSWRL